MHTYLIAILLLLSCAACDRRIYFPERVNVPVLKNAGDVALTGSLKFQGNSGDSVNGRTANNVTPALDLAFSPVAHLGILASYRWTNNHQAAEFDLYSNFYGGTYNGRQRELGAGYYTRFGGNRLFEIYAGFGFGDGSTVRRGAYRADRDFDARYRYAFLQAAVNFTAEDKTEIAAGFRLTRAEATAISGPGPDIQNRIAYGLDGTHADITEKPAWFIHPFFNTEILVYYLPVNIQIGLPVQVSGPVPGARVGIYATAGLALRYYKGIRDDWKRQRHPAKRPPAPKPAPLYVKWGL